MDHDVALVLAGGLVGLVSSLGVLALQRLWSVADRRNAADSEALDLAVRALMAWQANALVALTSGAADADAQKRLRALDERWEADGSLIPDREAADELLRRCKLILLSPREAHESTGMGEFNRLIALGDRVLNSARKRRRDLA